MSRSHKLVIQAETWVRISHGCSGADFFQPQDEECLATLKHYRSLIPMGQEARKPIFHLTSADGAIGSHAQAVVEAYKDFKLLAGKLTERMQAAPIHLPLEF